MAAKAEAAAALDQQASRLGLVLDAAGERLERLGAVSGCEFEGAVGRG